MKKIISFLLVIALLSTMVSCIAVGTGGKKVGNQPTLGQQLIDLKKARDEGAISKQEYAELREKLKKSLEDHKRPELRKTEERLIKEGHKSLSGEQVRELISGNTYRGSDVISQWPNFVLYYSADGQMRGRSAEHTDQGKWWITKDQYCRKWSKWNKGEEGCKHVYKVGELIHWFNEDGKMTDVGVIESGNPDNL